MVRSYALKKISQKMGISARAEADLRLPAKKEAVSMNRSEQDDGASGFAWVAREPQLMCGAKGARILTEINRLPQSSRLSPKQNCTRIRRLNRRFAASPGPGRADMLLPPALFLFN
jgi:hypothetical protein